MKRSEVNAIIRRAEEFFAERRFALPPVARWTDADWRGIGVAARGILAAGIGWDITDFGRGDFSRSGLLLFTLRNGRADDVSHVKPYAEKIMVVEQGQRTPMHCHWKKTEDIINRGGGNLALALHHATADDRLADSPVTFTKDGVAGSVDAGGEVALTPGESITIPPRLFHSFWGADGTGRVLVGEVSTVNDDAGDNCFYEKQLRFPEIEEDEPPYRLLVGDYARVKERLDRG